MTRERVERFYAEKLDEERAVASCNYYLVTLKSMFNLAADRGFVEDNPTKGVKTKRANNRRERMLTPEEAEALVGAAYKRSDYLRPLFVLLLGTGMRLGEALSLAWSDVDLGRGVLRIREAKNEEGRWVQLAADVLGELARWKATIPGEHFVFPGRRKRDGSQTHVQAVKKGWASLCSDAGVKVNRHELRHNFVSQALAAGYSPADIMPVTGHRSMKAFEGYAHTLAARRKALVEAVLPSSIRQRLPGDCPTENESEPKKLGGGN